LSSIAAPVSRSVIVMGKVLGGATLATIQGVIFLLFAPLAGVHVGAANLLGVALVIWLVSFSLTALGFAIAWPMDSSQAFHAVVNLVLLPIWVLSGALFPVSGASPWIRAVMRANPLTYGDEALRSLLFPGSAAGLPVSADIGILAGFSLVMFGAAFWLVNRRTTRPAA